MFAKENGLINVLHVADRATIRVTSSSLWHSHRSVALQSRSFSAYLGETFYVLLPVVAH